MSAVEQIKKAVATSRNVLVVCHVDPDADTIGSMIAMALMLERLGKIVTMYSRDTVPQMYLFLPSVKKIKRTIPKGKLFDLAIAVDAGDIRRIGSGIALRGLAKTVINIDHHPDNTRFGDINHVELLSSTAELVFELAKSLKVPVSKDIAVCLYTAMITDTGNFRYENTNDRTFAIAAELYRRGASPDGIATRIYDTKPLSSLMILAMVLSNIRTALNGKIVWSTITEKMMRESGAKSNELAGIIDHLRSIDTSVIALLFREERGLVKVNLRSKAGVNVQKIAAQFGGGGHKRASGISIRGDIKEIVGKVISYIKAHLK